ncbi:hypothetical protein BaRGS_00009949 [Batillaria attramentaria]|uniref:Uncharacterized protein n=1 Tax=Batillaria attramentaria TaxID=370345 RepID=A0ABD0LH27_9CAEN
MRLVCRVGMSSLGPILGAPGLLAVKENPGNLVITSSLSRSLTRANAGDGRTLKLSIPPKYLEVRKYSVWEENVNEEDHFHVGGEEKHIVERGEKDWQKSLDECTTEETLAEITQTPDLSPQEIGPWPPGRNCGATMSLQQERRHQRQTERHVVAPKTCRLSPAELRAPQEPLQLETASVL